MKDRQSFWDASAIVPLCLQQGASPRARQMLRQYPDPVVWWATLAEVRSAIARAVRVGRAGADERTHALRGVNHLIGFWHEVDPNDLVRDLALKLLDEHPLRTSDALQLAAALA